MKYQIFIDENLVYSSDYPVGKYVALKPKLEQAWGLATLTFIKPEDVDINLKSVITAYRDKDEIFRGRPISSSMDFHKKTTVKCESDINFLRDSFQPYHEYKNVSTTTLLTHLLDVHNLQVEPHKRFKLGNVGINVFVTMETNFESTFDVLDRLTEVHSGYFKTRHGSDGYYLDYLSFNGGGVSKQVVEFGENLLDFNRNKKLGNIFSVILPLGAREGTESNASDGAPEKRLTVQSVNDGEVTIRDDDLVSKYGVVTKIKVYDDIVDPTKLKQEAIKDLTSQITDISLEVKFVDMHLLDNNTPSFQIGEQVRVISKPHDLDRNFVLSKLSLDMANPANSKITLGRSVSSKLTDTVKDNTSTGNKLKDNTVTRGDIVQEAKKALGGMFNTDGEGSYVLFDTDEDGVVQQILAMDSTDASLAQKKLVLNQNGLAGSSDGGNSYATAITTDGWIHGDRVIAGTISAGKIDVSYTEAQDKKWKDELNTNYYTKVETNSAIRNEANNINLSVESKLSNLTIGASNLIKNSTFPNGSGADIYKNSSVEVTIVDDPTYKKVLQAVGITSTSGAVGFDTTEDLTTANEYTFSFRGKATTSGAYVRIGINNTEHQIDLTSDFAYYKFTVNGISGFRFVIYTAPSATVQIVQPQLERGQFATSFAPSITNYYSKSEIDVKDDAIELSVSKKLNTSDFGTKIRQSATDIQFAWNNISKVIQFENAQMNIYNGSGTDKTKLISFNSTGVGLYYKNYWVGKIGTSRYSGDETKRGLAFDLETDGAYMGWANMDSPSNSSYTMKMTYVSKPFGGFPTKNRVYMGCDLDSNGYYIRGHFKPSSGRTSVTTSGSIYLAANTNFSSYYGPFRVEDGLIVK